MANASLRLANVILFVALLVGCADPRPIQIEIDNEHHRELYLKLLSQQNVRHEVTNSGMITVFGETESELERKMLRFEEMIQEEIDMRNKTQGGS